MITSEIALYDRFLINAVLFPKITGQFQVGYNLLMYVHNYGQVSSALAKNNVQNSYKAFF